MKQRPFSPLIRFALAAIVLASAIAAVVALAFVGDPAEPAAVRQVTCGNVTRPAYFVPSGGAITVAVPMGASARALRVAACTAGKLTTDRLQVELPTGTPVEPIVTSPSWQTQSLNMATGAEPGAPLRITVRSRSLTSSEADTRRGAYVSFHVLRAADAERPNVILISLDTLRADRLGTYGYSLPTDPNLQSFAREGVVFTQAIAQSPSTPPSHAALLTARYPARTGLFVTKDVGSGLEQPGFRLRDALPTLAERLHEAGYHTAALTGGGFVSRHFGFDRGFDSFREESSSLPGEAMRTGSRAIDWLDANLAHRFFLFLHTYEVHVGQHDYQHEYFRLQDSLKPLYARHGTQEHRTRNARYDSGVQFADAVLGQIFRFLAVRGQLHKTLVVVTSDHGETMEERLEQSGYSFNHGFSLYDELIRVPLIMAGPGVPVGRRLDAQVESIDIMPTILDLAGVSPAGLTLDGRSLVPLMAGREAPKPYAYSESVAGGPFRSAIRMDGFKYVRVLSWALTSATPMKTPPPEELYDLRRDPGERTNLAGNPAYEAVLDRLRRTFDQAFEAAGTDEAIPATASRVAIE